MRHLFHGVVAALTFTSPAAAAVRDTSAMFRGSPAHTGVSTARFFGGQGGIRWRYATNGAVRSSPAVTTTTVFVGSSDGGLYAIDRSSGQRRWRYDARGVVSSSPAVSRGLVIAATHAGRIFAVDEATGRERWSRSTGPALPVNTAPAGGWDIYTSSPVIVDDLAIIGAGDGGVYALDVRTGTPRWKAQTGGRIRGTPAVADGRVVVGSWDGRVYALDLATGRERWVHRTVGDTLDSKRFGFDRRAIQSSPAIAEGMVFVGSRDGGFYGIDAATGERRWRATHRGSWVVGSPAVRDGRAYVGSSDGHFIHAVDVATGEDVWRLQTGANVLSSPLLVGDALIVGTTRTDAPWGDLLVLDAATGAIRWSVRIDDAVNSSPVVADGVIYVGTDAGSVVAIEEVNPTVPRLAVFFDAGLANRATVPGARLAYEHFRQLGYEGLDADSLGSFLTDRIADGVPSAVVFALDVLPAAVAGTEADSALIQRYLARGGKVVWIGSPVGAAVYDSTGRIVGIRIAAAERLTGVSMATLEFDLFPAEPTAVGRRWGLDRRVAGHYPIDPSVVSDVLARDELGQATGWVKRYPASKPGMGFVQLFGMGAAADRLDLIRAATEYGLLRKP